MRSECIEMIMPQQRYERGHTRFQTKEKRDNGEKISNECVLCQGPS